MFKHNSNNPNEKQADSKIIRDQIREWSELLKNKKNLLKITEILLKYKVKTFKDIELIQPNDVKNFLLEKNRYIISCILFRNFSEFLSEELQKKTIFDLPKEDLTSRLVISELDEKNRELLYTRAEILIDEYSFKFLFEANNIINNTKDSLDEEDKELKIQYIDLPTKKDIEMLKKQLTSYHSIFNFDSITSTKTEFSKHLINDHWETLYFYSEVRKKDYENNTEFYKNSVLFHSKIIKKYESTIKLLKESIYNTEQLLIPLNQHLEIPRLYLLPTPNHVHKATNKKQTGRLEELDKKDQDARALLKQKILEDPYLSEDEKNSAIEKVNAPSTNALFELDRYLGSKLEPKVNIVLRAIRAIVFEAVQSKKAESPHHPIKFSTNKLYELCGVKKHAKGGYHSEQTKNIISIITRSSLTEKILVKNEYNKIIKSTSFILESTFHSNKVEIKKNRKKELLPESIIQEQVTHITIKVSDFLFANHINQLENSYLQDVEGYIRFKKLNDTTIGNQLFLWLEIYLSRINKIKEVNLNTIVKELMLEERYKHDSKRVKDNIERAFKEMIELKTLIKDYKLAIGAKGQEKYILTNARYLEKPNLEMIKTDNKKTTKSKK